MTLLVDRVDFFRVDANRRLNPERRSEFGQFMTPPPTARLMASMFEANAREISLLDAGAGVGSLTAAFVHEISERTNRPRKIHATAYEIDPALAEYLSSTLEQCSDVALNKGIAFESELRRCDFIQECAHQLTQEMFSPVRRFDCAILNPPYKKITSDSGERLALREVGIETSNLYTAFLAIVLQLLNPGGELVAITPRSFCNGPYFKPFRKLLLDAITIRRIHLFDSRQVAFQEDEVLQENIIFHGVKECGSSKVTISCSSGPEDEFMTTREIAYSQLVHPEDPEHFIHIVPDELGASVAKRMSRLYWSLTEHNVEVSTGRVVDFRATHLLRQEPTSTSVPLIYPRNFDKGFVKWPKPGGKKAQAIEAIPEAEELLVPRGKYVLVKRFSSKEENRRIVAAIYDPNRIPSSKIGFENHLNYFHRQGCGLPTLLAKGIAAFLNSTLVDLYFRQFNGHTQVNATDLRNLRYPTRSQLEALGSKIADEFPAQEILDSYVEEALKLPEPTIGPDPVQAKKRIDEAISILKALELPREQQNERSALTLLALIGLKPEMTWHDAKDPLMGITPMMDFFQSHYGKKYAPNTRETVRRQTVHQFLDAGIVAINPDDPKRPTNSPLAVYQIEGGLLKLLRTFGTAEWEAGLQTYLASVETLKTAYAREHKMRRIPVQIAPGTTVSLSPGGQNILIEKILQDFCQFFTPGGKLTYIGDTDEKWAYFDESLLKSVGVRIEAHGKMPDVIVYFKQKDWLVLIEAVTSHGPVNPKRRRELGALFKNSKSGLVFVTAFLDRHAMVKYLNEISWETEVWVADAPTHLIHFNGERFLGPHET